MALKKNLTKAEFEALPDVLKAEYKEVGEGYTLDVDGEEDVGALKRAKDHEKERARVAEAANKELQKQIDAIKEESARSTGNVADLDKSWQTKMDAEKAAAAEKEAKMANQVKTLLVDNVAIQMASKLSKTSAKLLLPHITPRLTVDMDGDKPTTRVLDADGKISALTLEDLEKEIIANKDFSAIITQTNASGSSKADDQTKSKTGGSAPTKSDKPLADMKPDELLAYMNAKKGD